MIPSCYGRVFKPLLDRIIILLAAPVWGPLAGFVAVAIALSMGRPVIFRQQRPGLQGQAFTLLKFRTMTNDRGPDGQFLSDGERLAPIGRLLRALSLDELPTLINVLKGDMSLIGPRPLLMEYLKRYSPEQARRHELKPGITGWAQVNGRNAISWEDKFRFDVWYVDHVSLPLDMKILAATVWKSLKREGISQPGHATMEKFKGGRRGGDG